MYLMRLIYLIFLSLIFCFNSALVQAEDSERKLTTCELFEQAIVERDSDESFFPFMEKRTDAGIFYDYSWKSKIRSISIKRDENGYPIVRFSLFNKKVLPGQAVKIFNGIDLSNKKDDEIIKLHETSKKAELQLVNETNKITIIPKAYNYNNLKLFNFNLKSINEINTKKGLFEISYESTFAIERPDLLIDAKNIIKDEQCDISESTTLTMFLPEFDVVFNEYRWDIDLRERVGPSITYDNGVVNSIMYDYGIGEFRNQFNFRKFPFDTQELTIKINVGHWSTTNPDATWPTEVAQVNLITPEINSFISLEKYQENNYLKEWEVIETDIYSKFETVENFSLYANKFVNEPEDTLNIVIKLERNTQYYFFKIIIPVFVILLVAWSVLWIPIISSQLETRLTTSIVALLALIAYNFVFHDDIPKLEYLTNLDKYILLSYAFCAIPTFMTIFFSRFVIKDKQKLASKLNKLVRYWGGAIYITLVVLIFTLKY